MSFKRLSRVPETLRSSNRADMLECVWLLYFTHSEASWLRKAAVCSGLTAHCWRGPVADEPRRLCGSDCGAFLLKVDGSPARRVED